MNERTNSILTDCGTTTFFANNIGPLSVQSWKFCNRCMCVRACVRVSMCSCVCVCFGSIVAHWKLCEFDGINWVRGREARVCLHVCVRYTLDILIHWLKCVYYFLLSFFARERERRRKPQQLFLNDKSLSHTLTLCQVSRKCWSLDFNLVLR